MKQLIALCFALFSIAAFSQETFPYNGIRPKEVTLDAYVQATVWIDFQTKIENATLLVEKGRVVSCIANGPVPAHAVVHQMQGRVIYPSFIDMYSDYGLPRQEGEQPGRMRQPAESTEKGAKGWNLAIKSDKRAALLFSPQQEVAKEYRDAGFGSVLTHSMDGISRGTSAVVTFNPIAQLGLLKADAASHFSFSKGSSTQQYPSSLMGSIALLRQTYCDLNWYKTGGNKEERNLSLEALAQYDKLPQIFEANEKWNILRADKVGDEFGIQYIFKGGGDEYQRLDEIRATNGCLILPVQFPAAYDVSDPYLTRLISLEEMKHWELAPSNAFLVHQKGIPFVFTAHGLTDKKEFLPNIRKAIDRGLPEQEALKALTHTPASWLSMGDQIGALKAGMWANFFVANGNIFEEGSSIIEHFIQGERNAVSDDRNVRFNGKYNFIAPGLNLDFEVQFGAAESQTKATAKGIYQHAAENNKSLVTDTVSMEMKIVLESNQLTITIQPDSASKPLGVLRLAGLINGNTWSGSGQNAMSSWFEWTATRKSALDEKAKKEKAKKIQEVGTIIYPFTAYGAPQLPEMENVLYKNITIWTCEKEGKVEGDVWIKEGKIAAVGQGLTAPGAKVIDAKDKGWHITPGIIDEHSHIALASVNEGTQASSAEVKEASVLWPDDVDIYRQLSGGVVAAQLLHGSANPIGGQSALVKMRWGQSDQGMLIENADGFIKFALGENVKQSNWGDFATDRFPQTRMGVEQVYYDHFIRAREYGEKWKNFQSASASKSKRSVLVPAQRRDLEMEALLEIMNAKRFITCHSYVQSEINMLMHMADSMGFRINTFTHILEGYKVADKMKEHGAGGSTFSDWWAYKMEVKDAIPFNAAIMHKMGITVAINSDDAEMARRLNQEAGKTVKYGGVSEEEALKMVTLNPAILLHLDSRMGSIKVGKDADVVVWSAHPLSIYAEALNTYIDGRCYYSREMNEEREKSMELERQRLIAKMLESKNNGEPTQLPAMKHKRHFHCDTEDQSSTILLR